MKAIQITAPFNIGTTEIPYPEMGDDNVLLKINYVGFCGSDLNTYRGGNTMVSYPRIPGHEVSATICEMGKNVPANLTKGMQVTVNPYTHCGHCEACRNRRYNACEQNETLGVQRDGAMREYLAIPWQKIIPAEGIRQDAIALVEPLSVGFHAVSRGMVTDVDTVMVIGCGMVGMGAIHPSRGEGDCLRHRRRQTCHCTQYWGRLRHQLENRRRSPTFIRDHQRHDAGCHHRSSGQSRDLQHRHQRGELHRTCGMHRLQQDRREFPHAKLREEGTGYSWFPQCPTRGLRWGDCLPAPRHLSAG